MAKEPIDELLLKKTEVDVDLSEKDKLELEREAEAEVAKELKAEKRKEFKAAAKQRLKKQMLFKAGKDDTGADTEVVLIQLASQGDEIRLDGKRYIHGRVYRMSQATAQTVKEVMFRGDMHDSEIHGKTRADFYGTRPRNLKFGPNTPLPPDVSSQLGQIH